PDVAAAPVMADVGGTRDASPPGLDDNVNVNGAEDAAATGPNAASSSDTDPWVGGTTPVAFRAAASVNTSRALASQRCCGFMPKVDIDCRTCRGVCSGGLRGAECCGG
ncbi:hypothetical protein Vafri_10573, partial [Volvox africanus]